MKKFKITERGINSLLIFILGFLVGVALKTEAQKRVTIGYNDYLVSKYKQDINLMAPALQNQEQNQPAAEDQNSGETNQGGESAPAPDSNSVQPR